MKNQRKTAVVIAMALGVVVIFGFGLLRNISNNSHSNQKMAYQDLSIDHVNDDSASNDPDKSTVNEAADLSSAEHQWSAAIESRGGEFQVRPLVGNSPTKKSDVASAQPPNDAESRASQFVAETTDSRVVEQSDGSNSFDVKQPTLKNSMHNPYYGAADASGVEKNHSELPAKLKNKYAAFAKGSKPSIADLPELTDGPPEEITNSKSDEISNPPKIPTGLIVKNAAPTPSSPSDQKQPVGLTSSFKPNREVQSAQPSSLPPWQTPSKDGNIANSVFKPTGKPAENDSGSFAVAIDDKPPLDAPRPLPTDAGGSSTFSPPAIPAPSFARPVSKEIATSSSVINQRAHEHIAYGKSLARRGSMFAARQEFLQALRLIAEAYDMNSDGRKHTNHLAKSLSALAESEDFVTDDSERQLNLDVDAIIATHTSRVIEDANASDLTAIQALRRYYSFASKNLADAAGQSKTASEALYCLGKLLSTAANYDSAGKPMDRAKAIVMFQASLAADDKNYRSAHELGVLMARNGKWNRAKTLFKQSLRIRQMPESWKGLEVVHRKLNENDLAALAANEYTTLVNSGGSATGNSPIQLVSSDQFAKGGTASEFIEPNQSAVRSADVSVSKSKTNKLLQQIKDWF